MIRCAICETATTVELHRFIEGDPFRPKREWQYVAALYHHPTSRAPYCSAACATKGLAP